MTGTVLVLVVVGAVLLWPGPATGRAAAVAAGRWGAVSTVPQVPAGVAGDHPYGSDPASGLAPYRAVLRSVISRMTRHRDQGDIPALIDALSAAIRAGLPVSVALSSVQRSGAGQHGAPSLAGAGAGPPPDLLAGPLAAARSGASVAAAWHRVARQTGSPDLAMVARAWDLSERIGARLADGLDLAAETARQGRKLQRTLDSATAGARATSVLLTALPLAGIVLAGMTGQSITEVYANPIAVASGTIGLMLLLAGRRVVRGQIARVSRHT